MPIYRESAAPIVRVTYGDEVCARATGLFAENSFVATLAALDDELFELFIQILRSQRTAGQARGVVGVAEFLLEQEVRRTLTRCEDHDGGRGGYVAGLVFPDGLTDEVQPRGQGQADATAKLLERLRNLRDERAKPVVEASAAPVEAGLGKLNDALRARDAADGQTDALVKQAQGLGHQHRTQVDAAMGEVRHAFPGDKRRQDAIFPEAEARRETKADAVADPLPEPTPVPVTPV